MKIFSKFLVIILLLFLSTSVNAYNINDLLKELDIPQWREKISNPIFVNQFNTPEKLKAVIDLADARGYDWRYRIRAIRLLGHIGTPQAQEALLSIFKDPFFHHECPSLKSYVAEALGDFSASKRLLEILKEGLKDPELLVREATAKSFGKIRMPESVKYLREAFDSEKSLAVKIAIVNALKSIGTEEANIFIKQIASDGNNKDLKDAFGGSL